MKEEIKNRVINDICLFIVRASSQHVSTRYFYLSMILPGFNFSDLNEQDASWLFQELSKEFSPENKNIYQHKSFTKLDRATLDEILPLINTLLYMKASKYLFHKNSSNALSEAQQKDLLDNLNSCFNLFVYAQKNLNFDDDEALEQYISETLSAAFKNLNAEDKKWLEKRMLLATHPDQKQMKARPFFNDLSEQQKGKLNYFYREYKKNNLDFIDNYDKSKSKIKSAFAWNNSEFHKRFSLPIKPFVFIVQALSFLLEKTITIVNYTMFTIDKAINSFKTNSSSDDPSDVSDGQNMNQQTIKMIKYTSPETGIEPNPSPAKSSANNSEGTKKASRRHSTLKPETNNFDDRFQIHKDEDKGKGKGEKLDSNTQNSSPSKR